MRSNFPRPMAPEEIANLVDELVSDYLMAMCLLTRTTNAERIFRVVEALDLTDLATLTVPIPRKDGTSFEGNDFVTWMLMRGELGDVYLNHFSLFLLYAVLMRIRGEMEATNQWSMGTDASRLLFQLCNAMAHGNRWSLKKMRSRTYQFKEFSLTRALDGQHALFDFMFPGDVLDLLQQVAAELRQVRSKRAKLQEGE